MCKRLCFAFAAAVFCFRVSFAMAQQPGGEKAADKSADKAGEKAKGDKKAPEDKNVMTKHSGKIGGEEVKDTATEGTMGGKMEAGTQEAGGCFCGCTKD